MKVDFSQTMKDLDGKIITQGPGLAESQPVTLRLLAVNALLAVFEEEKLLSGEEKVNRYNLAFLIHNATDEPVEITVENVAKIKQLISKMYAPLLVGQAWKMLEG